jgi:hypothetical protein
MLLQRSITSTTAGYSRSVFQSLNLILNFAFRAIWSRAAVYTVVNCSRSRYSCFSGPIYLNYRISSFIGNYSSAILLTRLFDSREAKRALFISIF